MTTDSEAESAWAAVDDYFSSRLSGADWEMEAVLAANAAAGLPPHDVTMLQGKFLHLLARLRGARRILEIGTLGGFSTIWLARALPAGGSLVTLEVDPRHAEVARANFRRCGMSPRVELLIGDARDSLAKLFADGAGPFDFVFIDADKASSAEYFRRSLPMASAGAVIVVDNVVRGGRILGNSSADDPDVAGIHAVVEAMRSSPRVTASALQTVGRKGWDGFIMAIAGAKFAED